MNVQWILNYGSSETRSAGDKSYPTYRRGVNAFNRMAAQYPDITLELYRTDGTFIRSRTFGDIVNAKKELSQCGS